MFAQVLGFKSVLARVFCTELLNINKLVTARLSFYKKAFLLIKEEKKI